MSEKRDLASLFEPISIGRTKMKNRLVFPAMCTSYSDVEGSITPRIRAFIEARAAGGVGMCIVPGTVYGTPNKNRPAIMDDKYIKGWSDLRNLLSRYGAKLFCQLHPDPRSHKKPEDYTLEQIHGLIRAYAAAAFRAKEAGLDGVEIPGQNHEIALFLSPYYNHRKDGYGGDLDGRSNFALEIVRAVKESGGPDLPVIFRVSVEERITGGRELAESLILVKLLEKAGVDAIHASIGCSDSLPWEPGPPEVPSGHNMPVVAEVKKVVSIPVITVGRINDLSLAAAAITKGWVDLVAIGRALLSDPDLPLKSLDIKQEEIRKCIACNQGCNGKAGNEVSCIQNPRTGREYLPEVKQVALKARKMVLIAGAGPAGLEAACTLAETGHEVRVCEQQKEAGGTFLLACKPPFKDGFLEVIQHRLRKLRSLGVEIEYGKKVNLELVREINPQVLVVATGSVPEEPSFPVKGQEVYTADQVLLGKQPEGKRILLVGGGKVGCEVADYLTNLGYRVDIVGRGESLTEVVNNRQQQFLIKRLREKGVRFIMGGEVLEVNLPRALLYINKRKDTYGEYDCVVLATGRKPDRKLSTAIEDYLPLLEVFTIGDAHFPRTALEAIHEAALLSTII
jgi:2,4-dienoyl-CoA reductase-like NADH-dependent reductase (Old Yellow Enzyme family)/NADPH-dependent glutamate synthase beta subunit-like oxidoreductase